MGKLLRKVKIEWSSDFAYAIGLIAADGCLAKNRRHISFVSKDLELVENLKTALKLTNRISQSGRGGEVAKKYYVIFFGDKVFYNYLNIIGLTSAKSRTIEAVDFPRDKFPDFLRGLFDGDGTFYTFWDTRWKHSFGFQISFASASYIFITWLQDKLKSLYDVRGWIRRGDGVYNLRYQKSDTVTFFGIMYHDNDILYLGRKFDKMQQAFAYDISLIPKKSPNNQKRCEKIYAAIAQPGRAEA